MIRRCTESDFRAVHHIINEAARKYGGVIPPDRYHDPYMPVRKLRLEIGDGVVFYLFEEAGSPVGVMGMQDVEDVTLIRHAYVLPQMQGRGVGGSLLKHLLSLTGRPVLVGTWADASWAVSFYEKHGFRKVPHEEKERLLRRYWKIPKRQVETSVVLSLTDDSRVKASASPRARGRGPSLR